MGNELIEKESDSYRKREKRMNICRGMTRKERFRAE